MFIDIRSISRCYCKVSVLPINNYFCRNKKQTTLKCTRTLKERNSSSQKKNLKNKNKVRNLTLLNFKIYCKATVKKAMYFLSK